MHDIDNMTDEELAKCFVNILKEYVDTFYDQVTSTCKIKGKLDTYNSFPILELET